MQVIWAQSLGWEDPLEKEVAAGSSILTWEIPWTEEPGRVQFTSRTPVSDQTTIAVKTKVLLCPLGWESSHGAGGI